MRRYVAVVAAVLLLPTSVAGCAGTPPSATASTATPPSAAPPASTHSSPTASDVAVVVEPGQPWIVYQWGSGGPDGIWLARGDGSDGHVAVTGVPGINQWHPDWSPDGEVIAFNNENMGAKDIWVADATGDNARMLYDSPAAMPYADLPAYSPDNEQIVAASYNAEPTYEVSTRSALVLIDASTGQAEEISVLEGDHMIYAYPRWSPSGDALVVSIGRFDETDTKWLGEAIAVLRRTDTGWSAPDLITDFEDFGSYPDWNPDGELIVFSSRDKGWFINIVNNRPESFSVVDLTGITPDLFTVRPDGTDLRQVTHTSSPQDAGQPSWTSDGRIIFTYVEVPTTGPRTAFIDADGSGLDVLSNGATHSRLRPTPRP